MATKSGTASKKKFSQLKIIIALIVVIYIIMVTTLVSFFLIDPYYNQKRAIIELIEGQIEDQISKEINETSFRVNTTAYVYVHVNNIDDKKFMIEIIKNTISHRRLGLFYNDEHLGGPRDFIVMDIGNVHISYNNLTRRFHIQSSSIPIGSLFLSEDERDCFIEFVNGLEEIEREAPVKTTRVFRAGFITQAAPNYKLHAFLIKEFQRLAPEYDFKIHVFTGENGAALEASIEQCIAGGYAAIFICLSDTEAVIMSLIQAKEAGLIIGMISSDLPPNYHHLRDFFVGSYDISGGKQAGQFVSRKFPDGANFVEVGGQEGHYAQIERRDGFLAGIADNIIELDSRNCIGGWDTNEAMSIMEEFIDQYGDKIDIVWCQWDDGASGVIKALQNAGKDDVLVIGMGGNSTGYRQIRDGTQALCVGWNFTDMVNQSLKNASALLQRGRVPEISLIPWDMITIDSIDSFPWPGW